MTIVQTNTDDEIERIGATDAIHKFTRAVGPQGPILWHYVTAGPDDGETIIFLHGNGESWHSWHHQISHFADRFKIVAIDIKGYGQSDKSEGNWH